MSVLVILPLLTAISCTHQTEVSRANAGASPRTESERLNAWFDQEFDRFLDFSPVWRTSLADKKDYDRLGDLSEAAFDEQLEWRRRSVTAMRAEFDYTLLTEEAKTSYDLWEYLLATAERGKPFRRYLYPIGRGGPQSSLPSTMINLHRVDTLEDMRAYNSRLRQIGRVMRQAVELAQTAAMDGIRGPRFDYDFAIDEIDRVISGEPFTQSGSSALWNDATEKVSALIADGLINDAEGDQLLAEARRAMVEQIAPAYAEVRAWLEQDIDNAAEQASGVWALPNGEVYYDYRLFLMTTLDLSSEEVRDIGLAEVDRIRGEMETLKVGVGFQGTLQEFFAFMREDPQFYFPDTDEGRQGYLDLADEYLDQMTDALPDYFGMLPKAELEVRRVEAFREQDGAAQSYRSAALDGSRPAVFYAHLSDMSSMPRYQLESIAYHEGVPGHHLQISVGQELEDIPLFRSQSGYTAFSEGWGLYAEALASEMGFYEDPYSDFGRLAAEIWRAIRLVVDTGLHEQRWSEEEAVEFFLDNSPQPEGAVRSEIQRYLTMPGQATAYKIGMMKFQELRERAQERMGGRFDIRQFHDTVLGGGALPLPVLEARVDRWIAESG